MNWRSKGKDERGDSRHMAWKKEIELICMACKRIHQDHGADRIYAHSNKGLFRTEKPQEKAGKDK